MLYSPKNMLDEFSKHTNSVSTACRRPPRFMSAGWFNFPSYQSFHEFNIIDFSAHKMEMAFRLLFLYERGYNGIEVCLVLSQFIFYLLQCRSSLSYVYLKFIEKHFYKTFVYFFS